MTMRPTPDRHHASLGALKAQLLDRFAREHATTMRVVRAFPETGSTFRPHERSASALELLATLAREQSGAEAVLDGTWTMPPTFPPSPETWADAVRSLDDGGTRVIGALERASADRLTASVPFFTGPGQIGSVSIHELLWFWLLDAIHPRPTLCLCAASWWTCARHLRAVRR